VCVGYGEGILVDGLDGPPDVDDLVAGLEELVGELGQVVGDAGARGRVGLVNVHALDGATKGCGWGVLCGVLSRWRAWATNGVVEDEDTGGAGAVGC
jgi:hypothetical protein